MVLALAGIGLCGSLASGAPPGVEWKELSRTPSPEPVLALAFVGAGRLLALSPLSVSLWRLDSSELRREARIVWPEEPATVRHAGGAILGRPGDPAAWLLSSHAPRARLVRIEGGSLVLDAEADAAPWPEAPEGLRFRAGTNLLEGLELDGSRPALIAVDPAAGAAVLEDGGLLVGAVLTEARAGGAVATLWPGALVVSSAEPPGSSDTLVVRSRAGKAWSSGSALRIPGSVRAVAALPTETGAARVAVALARASGGVELRMFEARLRP